MPNLIGLDLGTTTVTGVLLEAGCGAILRLAQRLRDLVHAAHRLEQRRLVFEAGALAQLAPQAGAQQGLQALRGGLGTCRQSGRFLRKAKTAYFTTAFNSPFL